MTPDEQGIFYVLIVGGGPGAGEFTYDASGNLRSANVGQVTTDPVQGITCQQGFSTFNGHGAVINLLSTSNGAFFQYQDLGTNVQGSLILVVASVAGTDPVTGFTYQAGMTGIDPAFGDSITTVGANIGLGQVAYTRNASMAAATGGGANQPKLQLDAPEQTTASHLQMWMTGGSPDASKVAQLILAAVSGAGTLTPKTAALLEIQGSQALTGIATPGGPPAGNALLFADTNGLLRMLTGLAGDTNLYALARQTKHITADQTINSTSPAIVGANSTPLSFAMAAGISYRFHAVIYWTQGATQAQQAFRLIGTGGLTLGNMRVKVQQIALSTSGQTVFTDTLATLNTDNAVVGASGYGAGGDIQVTFDGVITPAVGGTLNLEARCVTSNADTYTIRAWSFAEIMPE